MKLKKPVYHKKRLAKVVYLVQYFGVSYQSNEYFSTPIKIFGSKSLAKLYADSRNFEFQLVCLDKKSSYVQYCITHEHGDYAVTLNDLLHAKEDFYDYFKMLLSEKTVKDIDLNHIISRIQPFKVLSIDYIAARSYFDDIDS